LIDEETEAHIAPENTVDPVFGSEDSIIQGRFRLGTVIHQVRNCIDRESHLLGRQTFIKPERTKGKDLHPLVFPVEKTGPRCFAEKWHGFVFQLDLYSLVLWSHFSE
jgi:hypothetical protein